MDMIKKLFPYSFGAADTNALVIKILVYLVASAVPGFIIGLIPLIGGIVSWFIDIYCTMGWILAVLDYMKVFK